MATFTDAPWATPESNLEAGDFCACCLIDGNEGREKVKALCKLPIRSTPGGPVNKNALRNAAGRIFQMSGVSPSDKKKAAKRLVGLMRQAKITVGETVIRLAGER